MAILSFHRFMRLKTRQIDILNSVRSFKETHVHMLECLKKFHESDDYKRLTNLQKEYLSGFCDAVIKSWYRYDIKWRIYKEDGSTYEKEEQVDYSICTKRENQGLPIGSHFWGNSDRIFH